MTSLMPLPNVYWVEEVGPTSVEPMQIDISAWLGAATIVGKAVSISPAGPTVDAPYLSGSAIGTWVRAPFTVGTRYTVTFTVTDSAGRTETFSLRFQCVVR